MFLPKQIYAACEAAVAAPSESQPAVVACCKAYLEAFKVARATAINEGNACDLAALAYAAALPPLSDPAGIAAFIECVSRALLFEIIDEKKASRLFYAAQIARSAAHAASQQAIFSKTSLSEGVSSTAR